MKECMTDNNKENLLLPRAVRESISEMAEVVLPNDANTLNTLLGGRLMHWIDLAGALAALPPTPH
jgi:acyl-CoA hydrolase